ncbi:MAG: transcriptional regulator [Chitinophaga sp.]|nr:transcriptional regulator [Chitinophaga sp.]
MELAEIGQLVAKRRVDLILKQEDLSELAGVTIKTIYQLESGKGNPSFSTLEKILMVLGLDIVVTIKKINA